jgi:hypothetical protein
VGLRRAPADSAFRKPYWGLRIGASLAKLGADADSVGNKVGLMAGVFAGMDLNARWSVQAGLQYSKKGAAIDSNTPLIGLAPPDGVALTANYNYLSLPVQARYFPWAMRSGAFVQGGLVASYLLKAELVGLGDDFDEADGRIDVRGELSAFDVGLQGGIGYEWANSLECSLVYQYGIGNTLSGGNGRVNSLLWQFALGFRF